MNANLPDQQSFLKNWVESFLKPEPYAETVCIKQGWGFLQGNRSIAERPLRLNGVEYSHGLGTHAHSEIRITADRPITRFTAIGGIDDYAVDLRSGSEIVLSIEVDGQEIWHSPILTIQQSSVEINIELQGKTELTLKARELKDMLSLAHVDWVNPRLHFADGTTLDCTLNGRLTPSIPFSFQYGERDVRAFLRDCRIDIEPPVSTEGRTIRNARFQDRLTGLELKLELIIYDDFPAVEWVWRIENSGTQDTPILRDIQAIDTCWTHLATEKLLHYSLGSDGSLRDFLYQTAPLNSEFTLGSIGGRSSCGHLPFFNIQSDHNGLICAVGWTGQWLASVGQGTSTRIRAGMERTHLRLHGGEEIRTPRVLLIYWQGEPIDGNNLLRRFILKHHTRMINGKVPTPITFPTWGGMKTAEHENRIATLRQHNADYDYYWIDAGWYGPAESYSPDEHEGDWGKHVGNWQVNPAAHPQGLRYLSDKIHAAGMKFLLWFEPERAISGTPLTQEHPQWFLGKQEAGQPLLLNLGNADARRGMTDLISSLVEEHAVDGYRQDFNIDPILFWRKADAPDRQGITEIRYIEGLYLFWDTLLERHPHLLIDNCASGGRRIDLETISRSIPLWRSDVQCFTDFDPIAGQIQTHGLAHWIPCHTIGTHLKPGDTYNFRSAMSTGIAFHAGMYEATPIPIDYPWDWHHRMAGELRRVIECSLGDYYPLINSGLSDNGWLLYQMHRPDLGVGFIVAFRRPDSEFELGRFRLKAIGPGSYNLEDVDSQRVWTADAQELVSQGISIHLPEARSSKLIFYSRLSPPLIFTD